MKTIFFQVYPKNIIMFGTLFVRVGKLKCPLSSRFGYFINNYSMSEIKKLEYNNVYNVYNM